MKIKFKRFINSWDIETLGFKQCVGRARQVLAFAVAEEAKKYILITEKRLSDGDVELTAELHVAKPELEEP